MKKAFTLIELVMSIGLFAVLAISVSTMVISTLRGARRTAAVNTAKAEGQYALTDMTQVIKYSKAAVCPTATSVTLTQNDNSTVTYSLDGSNRLLKNLGGNVNLTTTANVVTSCSGVIFSCSPTTVTICYWIDAAGASDVTNSAGTGAQGIQFQSQVGLRNIGN